MNNIGFALVVALLRALAHLPYGLVARFGSGLGALLYLIPSRRKHIVQVNLQLCFPGKTAAEYELLGRSHFRHVVRSYVERGVQWFGSASAIEKLVQLESRIDLDEENAPPTIFMGFHFVAIEVGCMLYSMKLPITALYTPMSSKRLNTLAVEQRGRFGADMVMRADSARRILKFLRKGGSVMLAADMDHGIENSVFVPFFGVPACTLTSVSRLARLGRARGAVRYRSAAGLQGLQDDDLRAARRLSLGKRRNRRTPDERIPRIASGAFSGTILLGASPL